MMNKRGVYGADDVAWEVQAGRNDAHEAAYRKNPEAFDAPERLSAKKSLLYAHQSDGWLYQDSDNQLWMGYERNGAVLTFGTVDFFKCQIRFTPLQKATRLLVRWQPFSQSFRRISDFTMVAPKGCI